MEIFVKKDFVMVTAVSFLWFLTAMLANQKPDPVNSHTIEYQYAILC